MFYSVYRTFSQICARHTADKTHRSETFTRIIYLYWVYS